MSRFEIELSIQSFQLKVRGSREDVPLIRAQLGKQFAGT